MKGSFIDMTAYEIIIGVSLILTSIAIVILVLLQQSRRAGLSGAIAGGADTFFGKNKGRTIDAQLKKWTAVIAVLFLLSSIALGFMLDDGKENEVATTDIEATVENEEAEAPVEVEGETKAEAETKAE